MTRRRRVLIIAATTGYQTRAFAQAAQAAGFDVQLATDRCHVLDDPWADRAIAVRFEQPDRDAALLAGSGPFDGLVALGDRPTLLAAMAAERLGLPFHSVAAVEACRNKYLARERLREAGLNVPAFFRLPVDADPAGGAQQAEYPCVLKPLGLSASRGVIRADNPQQFGHAFRRIRAILAQPEIRRYRDQTDQFIQVEQYIPGPEFALEGLLTAGRLQVLAVFDKPDPLVGPFFEETIYVTPSRQPHAVQARLVDATQRAVTALGLSYGPLHAELRYNAAGAWLLEAAARPIGGLCAKCLRFAGEPDLPLEELILRHALGEDVSGVRPAAPASGVMMIPIPREGIYQSVTGSEEALQVPGISALVITAKEGQKLIPLPEGNSYLGFLFAQGPTAAAVEDALRGAHAALRFQIAGSLPVVRG